ncbi:MAG: DUF2461 domain-containing protein, partial [Thermoplasmata archaeon]
MGRSASGVLGSAEHSGGLSDRSLHLPGGRTLTEKIADEAGFTKETLRFLGELARNNDRDWFEANKPRYEDHVRAPSAAFVRAVGERLGTISRHLVADDRAVGGSIMRIYRDVRFSKDKSPYRTAVGIHFMHEGIATRDDNLPGFFFRLSPGESWVYAGIWHPESVRLRKIREAIAARSASWGSLRAAIPPIEGESLKRPPPGFDPDHRFIEDLKRKDFTSGFELKDTEVTGPRFPDLFIARCRTLDPLNRFLAKAVGI